MLSRTGRRVTDHHLSGNVHHVQQSVDKSRGVAGGVDITANKSNDTRQNGDESGWIIFVISVVMSRAVYNRFVKPEIFNLPACRAYNNAKQ